MSLLAPGKRDETARKGRFLFFSLTDIYNNQSASPLDHTPPTAHRQTHECEQRRHGAAERGGRGRPRPCSTLRFPTVTAKNMGNMYHVCFCSAPEFLKCWYSACIKQVQRTYALVVIRTETTEKLYFALKRNTWLIRLSLRSALKEESNSRLEKENNLVSTWCTATSFNYQILVSVLEYVCPCSIWSWYEEKLNRWLIEWTRPRRKSRLCFGIRQSGSLGFLCITAVSEAIGVHYYNYIQCIFF